MTTSHDERLHTEISSAELAERARMSGWVYGSTPSGFFAEVVRWHRGGHSIHGDEEDPGEAMRRIYAGSVPCVECGGWVEMNYHSSPELRRLGECFSCHHWLERIRQPPRQDVVIIDDDRGRVYYTVRIVGARAGSAGCLGSGGQRFDIEFFDGRKITTHDLWFGGEIPQRFLDRLPTNARFRRG